MKILLSPAGCLLGSWLYNILTARPHFFLRLEGIVYAGGDDFNREDDREDFLFWITKVEFKVAVQ